MEVKDTLFQKSIHVLSHGIEDILKREQQETQQECSWTHRFLDFFEVKRHSRERMLFLEYLSDLPLA